MTVGLFMMAVTVSSQTVNRPKTPAGKPVDGGKFILVSASNPTGFMSRTSWDGAFYFLGESDSNYASHAFTAKKNDNGTWSFYYPGEDETDESSFLYVAIPSGSGNLNAKAEEPVEWALEDGDIDGFYKLKAGVGNTQAVQGLYLHLNAGNQYFVISEEVNGGSWYPDYAGGTIPADNDYGYEVDDNGRAVMADHTSENWAFIQVSDVVEHMSMYKAYASIASLQNDIENGGYEQDIEDGLTATLNAVIAIYQSADFNIDEDPGIIAEMISKKKALLSDIEAAEAIEDADAPLLSAIANAKTAFKTNTSVSEIEAAIKALKNAVAAFQQGTGDLTALGTNMSFEDLTAQNGQETSSVANPPVGWNVYVNGKQVTTADEVRNNGITAWFGVNSDSNGEGKDGQYAFGIWTSGVPSFEISQKVEGLETGTYLISAGLMVGANGSGSRRTTQRIFGNLNSTYFASESEYDLELLDNSEVYDFAGLVEPQTDTELQPIEVRAYVYDGTLTFGLRTDNNIAAALRDSNNPAGGDGWFKLDNFRIQSLGYVAEDAAAVANYFIQAFEGINGEPMEASLQSEIQGILDKYQTVSAETPADEINNIITTLSSKINEALACVAAYSNLQDAIDLAYEQAEEYQFFSGFDNFVALIDEIGEKLDDGLFTAEDAEAAIAQLNAAYVDLQKSGIAVGEYINIIQNPSFEDMSAQGNSESDGVQDVPTGWLLKVNGEDATRVNGAGWAAINRGDGINEVDENGTEWTSQYTDGDHLWGVWAGNVPEIQLYQQFSGIPSGTYVLSCDMVVQYNWGGHCVTTQRIFANDFIQMYGAEETYAEHLNDTEDMVKAQQLDLSNTGELKYMNYAGYLNESSYGITSCPHHMSLTFGVDESGELTIGFRTNNVDPLTGEAHPYDSAGWFKLDNFQLFYESQDIPTAIGNLRTSGTATVISDRQFYTLDGIRVAQPQRGVTIVKNVMSDGTVKAVKVIR